MSQTLAQVLTATPSAAKWRHVKPSRRAGVLVSLFSVYSDSSCGIGEIADLAHLIDWCVRTGNSILQLLPLNILGALNCPYDALSSFALEPAFLTVKKKNTPAKDPLAAKVAALRRRFPGARPHVDYRIKGEKDKLTWELFCMRPLKSDERFSRFREENSYWLEDFALFMVLKAHHEGRPWFEWEEPFRARKAKALAAFRKENERAIAYQMWLQWQLCEQLKKVKAVANKKGVLLKGDLPLLVSRDSADVWAHPAFFRLDCASGAPPDMYCAKGQRWGMPTYNWEAISRDGYRYVKEKLRYAGSFYDLLRIDHVVGLFRIWSIPYSDPHEHEGLHGSFDPADERSWAEHGKKLLAVINDTTPMLLCAEDLGVIPVAATRVLAEFGIPGNDVERWAKDWKVRHDFLYPQEYRTLSVAMLSTHDTTSWAGWWENEAGTVDEGLFMRKCAERGIDYKNVKDALFDPHRSRRGRSRWRGDVSSADILVWNLAKRKEEVGDFIEMYLNSFQEKEKLWRQMGLGGALREHADPEIITQAFKVTLNSSAVFCIETIFDWLSAAGLLQGDPYQFRINTPGTKSALNWSLRLPLSLEELLDHPFNDTIKDLIASSGRVVR